MSIITTIKTHTIEAMKAHEEVRVITLRGVSAAFMNELVAKGKPGQKELTDDEAVAVLKRLVKQRRDSIEQFTKGGRADLAAAETAELKILESYLPATMPREEIKKIAAAKLAELGGTVDKAKAGQFTGTIMKELKGRADGADVKAVIDELLK